MAALTVAHSPSGDYQPAYNDNIYVVTDASGYATTNSNYRFIADVKSSGGTLLTRLKFPIHYGSSTNGVVNISRVLEDYVTHDWLFEDAAASGCTNSFYQYKVDFGYEYSTGATSPILQTTGVTSASGYVWNGYLNPIDWLSYAEENFLMESGSSAQFLTNNNAKRIHIDQKDWLYLLHDGTCDHLSVSFSGGSSVNIDTPSTKVVRVAIGSNIPGGIPSGTTSYTITPEDSGNNAIGSTYTITIDNRCSKYNNTDLFFLNRLGGVESFRFDMIRRDNYDIVRKSFKSNPYELSGTNYTYSAQSHSKSDYFTQANERITLNSNNITEAESEWLKELLMSPRVWMYDGTLKAVNITSSAYEIRKAVNDKVFNLTLEIETSFPDKSQRL